MKDFLRGYATALIDTIAAIEFARDKGGKDDAAFDGMNAALFVVRQMRPPSTRESKSSADALAALLDPAPPEDLGSKLWTAIHALESCDWTEAEIFAGESVVSRTDVLDAIGHVLAPAPP